MKKLLLVALACIATGAALEAQTTPALKKVLELKMPKTADDEMPGTRGAAVAWHPLQKKYYAVFAGNAGFPLAVFDAKGQRSSDDELTAMIDVRGIWYDPAAKTISGNGYADNGWFSYDLNAKGIPTDYKVKIEGMNQPWENAVGAYNPSAKQVLFLSEDQVIIYDAKGQATDSVTIHWNIKLGADEDEEDDLYYADDYNNTTVVYTGIKGQELGLLNVTLWQIELYDITTGYLEKTLSLPETATAQPSFNFAYANGIYWLFADRTWEGYK